MTSRKRTTIVGAIALALAIAFAVWWSRGSESENEVSMSFSGFTNFGPGNMAAQFCVTNGSPAEVSFRLRGFERHSGESWVPASFGGDVEPGWDIETYSLPKWLHGKTELSGPLPSGASKMVLLPVEDTNSNYRVRSVVNERRRGLGGLGDQLKVAYARLIEGRTLRLFLAPPRELVSENPSP
mgnify:CR=1 FL=1